MNTHEIRYCFEHRILPRNFYEYKSDFFSLILKQTDVLYKVINDIFEEEGVKNPYTENEFGIEVMKRDEELLVIRLVFPVPEDEPLCYCSYLFVDKKLQKLKYFCIERGNGTETVFVCSWTSDGRHINYGSCSLVGREDYERCLSIYSNEK